MRVVLFLSLATFVSCREPCSRSTSELPGGAFGNLTCANPDGGAYVRYRAYSTLWIGFVDACSATLDGGELNFTVTSGSCEPETTDVPPSVAECTLPTLPPGRYAVGGDELIVPADGGAISCE